MAICNKEGKEFTHCVTLACPKGHKPFYSHSFPIAVGNKVVERWSTKPRPIKEMTVYLRGCNLKRYKDYMVEYNPKTTNFEYWFAEAPMAMLFQLRVSTLQQEFKQPGQHLTAVCPKCNHKMNRWDIDWEV